MVGIDHLTATRRDTLEHIGLVTVFLVLVLDSRLPHPSRPIYLFTFWGCISIVLHLVWPGKRVLYSFQPHEAHCAVQSIQATAAMSPNAEIAALVFNALFAIIIVLYVTKFVACLPH